MISGLLFGTMGIYTIAILALTIGFKKLPLFKLTRKLQPKNAFSIIVPFRNENHNLPYLLDSIEKLDYPIHLFEVILVDDDSEVPFQSSKSYSFTWQIIKNHRRSNSPKKDAISTALQQAKTPWIISTDADCLVPKYWLLAFDQYQQKEKKELIAGPVTYTSQTNFLEHFQQLDLMSLQGATIGSFGLNQGFMCNGANLAYSKAFFNKLNGFEGNNQIASGDDVFLLQKALQKAPLKVGYLKSCEAIVQTVACTTWKELFFQRIRWAAKTTSYKSWFGKLLALIVFFGNASLLVATVLLTVKKLNLVDFETLLIIKICVDFILLFTTNRFLKRKKMSYWIVSSLIYPFFSTIVACYSLIGSYNWKGRNFKS